MEVDLQLLELTKVCIPKKSMSIEVRSDVINYLIRKRGYRSYLEIGLDHPDSNYNHINCLRKESVDPYLDPEPWLKDQMIGNQLPPFIEEVLTHRMTSDEYFNSHSDTFDIIFIDGLHEEVQAGRDIVNSLSRLNPGGIVVIHDCLPLYEVNSVYPRTTDWFNGTTWKALIQTSIDLGIYFRTVDTNDGIGLIEYQPQYSGRFMRYPKKCLLTWTEVFSHKILRDYIMHVITPEEFLEIY